MPKEIITSVFEFDLEKNKGKQTDYIENIEELIEEAREQLPTGVVIVMYEKDCMEGQTNEFYLLFNNENYLWIDMPDNIF